MGGHNGGRHAKYGDNRKQVALAMSRRPDLTVETAREMLPKVGDRLLRVMTYATTCMTVKPQPQWCTVVFVHEANRWYEVEFDNGLRECYKVPEAPSVGGVFR